MDFRKTASAAGAASDGSAAAAPARLPAPPPSIAPTEAMTEPHIHRRRVTAWPQQSMAPPPQDVRNLAPRVFRTDRLRDSSRAQGIIFGGPAWQRGAYDAARPLPLWPPDPPSASLARGDAALAGLVASDKGCEHLVEEARGQEPAVVAVAVRELAQIVAGPEKLIALGDDDT